jgi:hypothetical protein
VITRVIKQYFQTLQQMDSQILVVVVVVQVVMRVHMEALADPV